jgi:hypothetical protein
MKSKILLVLVLLYLSSCYSEDNKIVDLAKITSNFDASEFYLNRIKKTKEIISRDIKSMDK